MTILLFIGVLQTAVSVGLALEYDVTVVLSCEKLIDNLACLKARKKLWDRLLCWWQTFGIG